MLEALITSKTRIKLLMKFFLNSSTTSYLRDLSAEFGESSNAIRLELNHLEKAGLLGSSTQGNKKVFRANREHPLFSTIRQLLMKHTGIDQIIDQVIKNLRGLHSAYLTGSFALGKDNPVIDILLIGDDIDTAYLLKLIQKAETLISRKIRYMIVKPEEKEKYLAVYPEALLLWERNTGSSNNNK
ncbi:MAG: ArsR family transcriptional regulator [Lentimicrobiaceae bacterium]|nr:ArsR family transcriptional regulator [Lentimicrobiaceae bacterium]